MDYAKTIIYQSNHCYNEGLKKATARDMSGAIEALEQSLLYNRENIAARNLLGLVYYGIGEVPEALVEWIISKNLRPTNNIADYYIRSVQESANELETMNQAIRKYNQSLTSCRMGDEDVALITMKQVVVSHPTFVKGYQLLALLYIHNGQESRARELLSTARKLDTGNETTKRYLRTLIQKRGRRRRRSTADTKEKKNQKNRGAVEYNVGNETIIQPKHSILRTLADRLALVNVLVGAIVGAAIVFFLAAPAMNQSKMEKMNSQMREFSEEISTLEAQVSAQTRTLEEYRASEAEASESAAAAELTLEGYEELLDVYVKYEEGKAEYASLANTLSEMDTDVFGETALDMYEDLVEKIYPKACSNLYSDGRDAYNDGEYETAIENFLNVLELDESYNDGIAVYMLGRAYEKYGDTANAAEYYQLMIDSYSESSYAEKAESALEDLEEAAEEEDTEEDSEEDTEEDTEEGTEEE